MLNGELIIYNTVKKPTEHAKNSAFHAGIWTFLISLVEDCLFENRRYMKK